MASQPPTLAAVLERIAEGIRSERFRVLMIGGFALPAFGVERSALHMEFMTTDADLDPVSVTLDIAGYRRVLRTPQFARLQPQSNALPDIDLVFVDAAAMDAVWADRVLHAWAGVELPVASLATMLATKLHALKFNHANRAEKTDLTDVCDLLRANGIPPAGEYFRQLCEKFGTIELWQELCDKSAPRV